MKKNYKRSTNYRKIFFMTHKGIFKSQKYYFCSYCGRVLKKPDVQVDHLISIHSVKKPGLGRILMKLGRITDINDFTNLVPSCQYCNLQKGPSGGGWLIRGFLGRHPVYWYIRKTLFTMAMIFFTYINIPCTIETIKKIISLF